MSGQAPDEDALKKQTVDDLVDTELLAQEAESRGIEVSDARRRRRARVAGEADTAWTPARSC